MSLASLRAHTLWALRARRDSEPYRRARRRHAALEPYPSVASLLAVLERGLSESVVEREAAVGACLCELRGDPREPLWVSLLVLFHFPMLARLRSRLRSWALCSEELDMLVVLSFLEAVSAFPSRHRADRSFLRLRQMTERRVFASLREEHRALELLRLTGPGVMRALIEEQQRRGDGPVHSLLSGAEVCDVLSPWSRWGELALSQESCLVELIVELARDRLSPRDAELIVATVVGGEPLEEYIARRHRRVRGAERRRLYQRLKRARTRALAKLRRALSDLPGARPTETAAFHREAA